MRAQREANGNLARMLMDQEGVVGQYTEPLPRKETVPKIPRPVSIMVALANAVKTSAWRESLFCTNRPIKSILAG